MSATRKYGVASLFSLAGTILGAVLGLLNAIMMARVFGAAVLGELAIISFLIQAFNFVSNAGEQSGLYFHVSRLGASAETSAVLWATVLFSELLTLLLSVPFIVVCSLVLDRIYHQPSLFVACMASLGVYLVFSNISALFDITLQGLLAQASLLRLTLISGVVALLSTVLLPLVIGRTLLAAVAATSVAPALLLVLQVVALGQHLALRVALRDVVRGFAKMPSILSYGIRWAPNNFSDIILGYADTAILAALVSPSALGAYSRAYAVFGRLTGVTGSIRRTLFPTIARLYLERDVDGISRVVRRTSCYLALFAFPSCAGIVALAHPIMALFGPEFVVGAAALVSLSIGIPLNTISMLNGAVTGGSGAPGRVSLCIGGGAAVNLAGNIMLDPRYGLAGAGLANSAGMAFMAVSGILVTSQRVGLPVPSLLDFSAIVRSAVAAALMGVATYRLAQSTPPDIALVTGMPFGFAIYVALCFVVRPLDAQETARMGTWLREALRMGKGLLGSTLHRPRD
jgi:O-antigen/teichoic acid export membrane protein